MPKTPNLLNQTSLIEQIRQKQDIEKLVNQVIQNPGEVDVLVKTIQTDTSSIKFGCEKILRLVSEKKPELIYPYFDFYVGLLDHENSFLKWGAIMTVANLTVVDTGKKFEKIFAKYFALISNPVMVTAANVIGNAWKICLAKPELTDRVVKEILKLEKVNYLYKGEVSPECKKIVCGAAIETFTKVFEQTKQKQAIRRFVQKQLQNTRPSVRKSAEKFMQRFAKSK